MNYPVWYVPTIGGGLLIALISIFHVCISHFAVGGGFYLVFAERKGYRENNPAILAFTRSHARFFLLMTAILGGISGVGIWFIIGIVNPAATSLLIHAFVFGWATEWVFFLVEIVAIAIYYYAFDRLTPQLHQAVGWIYALAAWCSLFVINGIIDFMLTPGEWTVSHDFWAGFFNETFWPALAFRTCLSLMFAGVYAFLTTAFLRDAALKRTMSRFSGGWVLGALLAALPCGWWYLADLPPLAHRLATGLSPTITRAAAYGTAATVVLAILTLLLVLTRPALHTKPAALLVFATSFVLMGAFEWSREAARRPYVVNGVLYSTGIAAADLPRIDRLGFLPTARWTRQKEVHEESLTEAGAELFKFQCYACHTVRGFNNDIVARTATMSYPVLQNYLATVHQLRPFMPPVAGTADERRALAAYIIGGLQRKPLTSPAAAANPGQEAFRTHCTICHPESLVKSRTAGWDRQKIRWALDHLNTLQPAMPNFTGPPAQKDLIAGYIYSLNHPAAAAVPAAHDPGEDVFEAHCSMCHTLRGGGNPLLPKVAGWDRQRIRAALDMLDTLKGGVMPPLTAPAADKEALADFLFHAAQGGNP